MTTEKFNKIVERQIDICKEVLGVKAGEYATEDRLHNFKIAAFLCGGTVEEALAGMMVKHIVSIYDMCRNTDGGYPISLWEEKITDSINYLLLLKSVVCENDVTLEEQIEQLRVDDITWNPENSAIDKLYDSYEDNIRAIERRKENIKHANDDFCDTVIRTINKGERILDSKTYKMGEHAIFKCFSCEKTFERYVTDVSPLNCPHCSSNKWEVVIDNMSLLNIQNMYNTKRDFWKEYNEVCKNLNNEN